MAFVTDSNRPQPLRQSPPTACLTASGPASEVPSRLLHPCPPPPLPLAPPSGVSKPWPEGYLFKTLSSFLSCLPLPPPRPFHPFTGTNSPNALQTTFYPLDRASISHVVLSFQGTALALGNELWVTLPPGFTLGRCAPHGNSLCDTQGLERAGCRTWCRVAEGKSGVQPFWGGGGSNRVPQN